MATRSLLVRILGDDKSVRNAFERSSASARTFGKDVTGTASKVDAAFTKTQKLMAGGFIGGAAFASAVAGIRAVVAAASDQQQILGQTRVALEATGKSWQDYGRQIETTVKTQSRLGFDDEALLKTFSLFERNTGDVTRALELNNVAMDVARGRFIDLDQAAQLVNKAALGQAGALRRLGIDAKAGSSGLELITLLQQKYAGSARDAANTAQGSFDRVNVSIENVKESLGTLLLPAVQALADDLDAAARSADLLVSGLSEIGKIKIPTIHIPFVFDVPGTGGTVGDLAGKVAGIAKFTPLNPLFGVTIAKGIADQFDKQTKAAAPGVKFRFGKSLDDLIRGATQETKVDPAAFAKLPGVSEKGVVARQFGAAIDSLMASAREQVDAAIKAGNAAIAKDSAEKAARQREDAFAKVLAALELGVDRAGLTKRLDDDVKSLVALKVGLEKQIAAGVDVAAAQTQLVTVVGQIASKQAEIRQAAADAVQARQFRALGLTAEGGQVVPGVENLRKQLSQLTSRLLDEGEMTPKIRSQLQRIGKVLSGGFGKVTEETRGKVRDMFRDIRQVFGEETNKGLGQDIRRVTLSDKILAALGFGKDPDVIRANSLGNATRALSSASGVIARASMPAAGVAAGMTVNIHGDIVTPDPQTFLRDLQKMAGRTSATARGRFPGRSLGLG